MAVLCTEFVKLSVEEGEIVETLEIGKEQSQTWISFLLSERSHTFQSFILSHMGNCTFTNTATYTYTRLAVSY